MSGRAASGREHEQLVRWSDQLEQLAAGRSPGTRLAARQGDISALLSDPWGKLPVNSVLTGKMYFAEGRAYARLTRAWTPQGTSFPICAELWERTGRGLELRPGSTPGEVEAFSTSIIALPVRRFD